MRTCSVLICFSIIFQILNVVESQLTYRKPEPSTDLNRRQTQNRARKSESYDHVRDIIDNGIVNEDLRVYTSEFARKVRDDEKVNHGRDKMKYQQYDYDYPIHQLCEEEKSGQRETDTLDWTESGDRLLKIIGNGVVENGYNMFMAPGQSRKKQTDVHVAIYIESMGSFKAQSMDFEVDMYLAMGWFDRRLAHNCTHPILVTNKHIADRMWYPDLYFVNSKYAYLQEVTTPNLLVVVYPDGLIFKSMRLDVTLSCMMDLKYFPLDTQECPLTIQSFAYIEQIVNVTWREDNPNFPITWNADIKLNDMELMRSRYIKCPGPYPMFRGEGTWSCIRGYIIMKRLVLFHIIQTYIPTAMLVSISWMSFWLDPRASPARISLTITTLLTLTTMSNGARQDLPQVSYIKALDVWLTFSQALIFLVLLEYSFVSYYMTKRTSNCHHRSPFYEERIQEVSKRANDSNDLKCRKSPKLAHLNEAMTTDLNRNPTKAKSFSITHGISACLNESAALVSSVNPRMFNKFDNHNKPCARCAEKNEKIAFMIDEHSRWLFPAVFTIFCGSYWIYYSTIPKYVQTN
ncbi:unnamed protein product [Caenorhabditis angaria]|uniref:Uncharacterized protein n=1 Tax=Caenorhabditis angaria TaxID=860376 RepID=A0A9P1N8Y8_9PELO|nr:unnamed protein product [Caenorhabditis angaria]